MNDTKIFEQSKWIIEQLENYGHKAFFLLEDLYVIF